MAMNHPTADRLPSGTAIDTLREATAALTAEPVERPPGFVACVMVRIRQEPRRFRKLPLPAEPPHRLSITEHAAATLLSAATSSVPGTTGRGCRFPTPGDPTHVAVSISLRYGQHASTTAHRVRAALHAAAATQLGLRLLCIDITIDDVHPRL
ncbi:hypothetical protein [Streptomyces sp. ME19-01-6]|uniref:hypothetical protein n=1 Tax=Streptomyces sp. ME19-01-6 TaxID=3028686 RepID=UPI0029CA9A2D|nr:hypothetical protein [Streptomyces sp. ME19-01-6]